jgi:hypothetical protein
MGRMVSSLLTVLGLAIVTVASDQSRAAGPTRLVSFCCPDGDSPKAGVIADANGSLFGATAFGGAKRAGTAFEIAGGGYVFAGTPGKPSCFDESVSALARQYGGLNGAAVALGYPSVSALQQAIMEFCED